MPNAAGVWQALQGIGVIGILMVCLWAVSRGAYIPRAGHQEVLAEQAKLLAELSREVTRLEGEVARLESALAARGDD
jgi:hypothetical protein